MNKGSIYISILIMYKEMYGYKILLIDMKNSWISRYMLYSWMIQLRIVKMSVLYYFIPYIQFHSGFFKWNLARKFTDSPRRENVFQIRQDLKKNNISEGKTLAYQVSKHVRKAVVPKIVYYWSERKHRILELKIRSRNRPVYVWQFMIW